jgi:hypothetical protein
MINEVRFNNGRFEVVENTTMGDPSGGARRLEVIKELILLEGEERDALLSMVHAITPHLKREDVDKIFDAACNVLADTGVGGGGLTLSSGSATATKITCAGEKR